MNKIVASCIIILCSFSALKTLHSQYRDSMIITKDTLCSCSPSLPLEIATTSIIWGLPIYWAYRGSYPKSSKDVTYSGVVIIPSLFLLMFTLGPISELTSKCEASWWNTLWIGFGTSLITGLAYGSVYGFKHPITYSEFSFNAVDYLALGVLPSVSSCLIYNLFLHPRENNNHSMYLLPSFGGKNTASLNFMMQF